MPIVLNLPGAGILRGWDDMAQKSARRWVLGLILVVVDWFSGHSTTSACLMLNLAVPAL